LLKALPVFAAGWAFPASRLLEGRRRIQQDQAFFAFFTASVIAGTTSKRSPTIP
jgi:hypothetical protein